MGMQSRPYLQATERVVEPDGEQRDEPTIYLDLARACGAPLFGSAVLQKSLEWGRDRHARKHPERQPGLAQEFLMTSVLRLTGNGSFDKLLTEKHGRRLPDHAPGTYLGARVATESGRLELAPADLVASVGKLEDVFDRELANAHRLKLITKRHVKTHNSWTHNDPEFVKGSQGDELPLHASRRREGARRRRR